MSRSPLLYEQAAFMPTDLRRLPPPPGKNGGLYDAFAIARKYGCEMRVTKGSELTVSHPLLLPELRPVVNASHGRNAVNRALRVFLKKCHAQLTGLKGGLGASEPLVPVAPPVMPAEEEVPVSTPAPRIVPAPAPPPLKLSEQPALDPARNGHAPPARRDEKDPRTPARVIADACRHFGGMQAARHYRLHFSDDKPVIFGDCEAPECLDARRHLDALAAQGKQIDRLEGEHLRLMEDFQSRTEECRQARNEAHQAKQKLENLEKQLADKAGGPLERLQAAREGRGPVTVKPPVNPDDPYFEVALPLYGVRIEEGDSKEEQRRKFRIMHMMLAQELRKSWPGGGGAGQTATRTIDALEMLIGHPEVQPERLERAMMDLNFARLEITIRKLRRSADSGQVLVGNYAWDQFNQAVHKIRNSLKASRTTTPA